MDALLTQSFLTALLFGAVTAGVPLLLIFLAVVEYLDHVRRRTMAA